MKATVLILAVFALHVSVVFLLYRADHYGAFQSDTLNTIALPAALAFAGYVYAFVRHWGRRLRAPLVLLLSAATTSLSLWAAMLVSLGTYGQ
jgi:hypothetical protein